MLNLIRNFFKGLPFESIVQYGTSSIICQVLRLAGIAITTHYLRIEEFGVFAQITVCLGICGILSGMGHHDGLIAYQGSDSRYFRFHFQMSLLIGLISISLLLFIAPHILGFDSPLLNYQLLGCGILLVEAIFPHFLIRAQKSFRFKYTGVIDFCAVISWILVIVIGLFKQKGVELLLLARFVEAAVRLVLLSAQYGWGNLKFCFDRDVFDYYKAPYFKNVPFRSVVDFLIVRMDILILSHFVSTSELGIYERVQYFIQISTSISVNLIDRVSMMSFSKMQKNKESLKLAFNTSLRYVISASLGATAMITIALPWGLDYFVSKEISKSLLTLWYFSAAIAIFKPVAMMIGFLLLGIGCSKILLEQNIWLLITMLLLLCLLVPLYGIYGASSAISLSYLMVVVIQMRKVKKIL